MNFDDWGHYSQSHCPLRDCDFHLTWPEGIDREWLDGQLMAHIQSHTLLEWVREVVALQCELLAAYTIQNEAAD